MNLNVGCGGDHKPGLNLDLHHPADILGSVECLPFRNRTFKTATAIHVLEHCRNPYRALGECVRVARIVYVVVPWITYYVWDRSHRNYLTAEWLEQAAKRLGRQIKGRHKFNGDLAHFGIEFQCWIH